MGDEDVSTDSEASSEDSGSDGFEEGTGAAAPSTPITRKQQPRPHVYSLLGRMRMYEQKLGHEFKTNVGTTSTNTELQAIAEVSLAEEGNATVLRLGDHV